MCRNTRCTSCYVQASLGMHSPDMKGSHTHLCKLMICTVKTDHAEKSVIVLVRISMCMHNLDNLYLETEGKIAMTVLCV